jgi:PAS domain S-box-containing protein
MSTRRIPSLVALVVALVLLVFNGLAINGFTQILNRNFEAISEENLPAITTLGELESAALTLTREASSFALIEAEEALAGDIEAAEWEQASYSELIAAQDAALSYAADYQTLAETLEHEDIAAEITIAAEELTNSAVQLADLKAEGASGAAIIAQIETVEAAEERFAGLIDEALTLEGAEYLDRSVALVTATRNTRLGVASFTVVGIAVSVAGFFLFRRQEARRRQAEQAVRQQAETLRTNQERLRTLYGIGARTDLTARQKLDELVKGGTQLLGLQMGIISRIEGDTYTVRHYYAPENGLEEGQQFELGQTYCAITVNHADVFASGAFGQSAYKGHPAYAAFGLESYIGAPITVNGEPYGTLNFSAPPPRERPFTAADYDFVRLMAEWVSGEIEAQLATEALQESEERFRQMAENIDEVIWMTDPAKDKMVYISPFYEQLWGRTVESLYARPQSFVEGIHPDDRERVLAAFPKQVQGTYDEFYRVQRPDGEVRWVQDTAFPITNEQGEVVRVVGIARDFTAEREANQTLREQAAQLAQSNRELAVARRQAEDANRLKSEFLATMSHELRTPLNAIIGYTDIQLKGMTGELNDQQRGFMDRTLQNAENLLDLINDVLDLAKIEAGRADLVLEYFQPGRLAQAVHKQLAGLADRQGITLTVTVDERLPERMVGDIARLKQIAINLVSNGIKFTEEGSVEMAFRRPGGETWEVVVTDTGAGIPPHQQEIIFDEFRQAEGGSNRQHGGTGLGLAIVRNLAMMMGGQIKVKSKVGEGSTFTVTLPVITELPEEEYAMEGTA